MNKITVLGVVTRVSAGSKPINFNELSILYADEQGIYSIVLTPYPKLTNIKNTSLVDVNVPSTLVGDLIGDKIYFRGFLTRDGIKGIDYIKELSDTNASTPTSDLYDNWYSCAGNILTNAENGIGLTIEEWLTLLYCYKEALKNTYEELQNLKIVNALVGYSVLKENIYLEPGELYEVMFTLPNPLVTEETWEMRIIPKEGQVVYIEHQVPSVLPYARVVIYPT